LAQARDRIDLSIKFAEQAGGFGVFLNGLARLLVSGDGRVLEQKLANLGGFIENLLRINWHLFPWLPATILQ
jgi:hypothetical protein